jgi:hypothetical protein
MKVICVKFNSGEEIIGRVVEATGLLLGDRSVEQFPGTGPWKATGYVTLEKVRGITAQQIGKNEMGIAFFPWALGNSDAPFTFNLDVTAAAVYPAETNLEEGYLDQTSPIARVKGGLPGMKM